MKLFRVDFNSGRPPMITKGETRAKVSREMKDMFGEDEVNRVDYISVQDAQAEFGYWQFEGSMSLLTGENLFEKAKSKSQQRFMGMVRATQKGEMDNPSPEVAAAAKSMSAKAADDYASTKHKGLPNKVKKEDAMTDQNSPSNRNPQKKIKRTNAKVHTRKDMQEQVPATMADLKSLDKLVKKQRKLGEAVKQRLDPKCWDGYKKQGTKMKNGVRVNNCVPEEFVSEAQMLKHGQTKPVEMIIKKIEREVAALKRYKLQDEGKDDKETKQLTDELNKHYADAIEDILSGCDEVKGLLY